VSGWIPADLPTYAYVLGLYLGDGHVYMPKKGNPNFCLFMDAAYPGVIEEARQAVTRLVPGQSVTTFKKRDQNCIVVRASSPDWPDILPQCGPGRKHERPIALRNWQRLWLDETPEMFLRGLIHSDGCRTVNRFKTTLPSGRVAEYEYVRYFFSNLSADIRALFCEYCEKLGIRWTQSNHRNISVSHRHSVAKLEAFVGPKA
jgi:hypothetical protein